MFLATAVGKLLDNRGFAGVLANFEVLPFGPLGLFATGLVIGLAELGVALSSLAG